MNWIVRADFPTPPPPTTTSLYSVKSFEAAIASAYKRQIHIHTHSLDHTQTVKWTPRGNSTQHAGKLHSHTLVHSYEVLCAPALITAVILSAGLPFHRDHSVIQWAGHPRYSSLAYWTSRRSSDTARAQTNSYTIRSYTYQAASVSLAATARPYLSPRTSNNTALRCS